MPGPNSAPNGDSRLVHGMSTHKVWNDEQQKYVMEPIRLREKLRRSGKLRTGKTAAKRK